MTDTTEVSRAQLMAEIRKLMSASPADYLWGIKKIVEAFLILFLGPIPVIVAIAAPAALAAAGVGILLAALGYTPTIQLWLEFIEIGLLILACGSMAHSEDFVSELVREFNK